VSHGSVKRARRRLPRRGTVAKDAIRSCDNERMPYAVAQQHPRFAATIPVGIVTDQGDVVVHDLVDISMGGVFVRTPTPAAPGSCVRLRLLVGEVAAIVPVMGRVVHVIDQQTGKETARAPGMGVMFDGLAPEAEGRLRRFVDGLEVRRALKAIEERDGFGALGLAPTATASEVIERATHLLRAFTAQHADASARQRARLQEGMAAVRRLEDALLAFIDAVER
jgi:hypothetical protein